jgi:hypothetical protein
MSRRLRSPLYTGASGRLELGAATKLDHRWWAQPKYDGSFTTVRTDSAGLVAGIWTRSGNELPRRLTADFFGVRWIPDSILHCEAEVWTEASNRVSAARGYRCLWAFDALRVHGTDTSRLTYAERRDWLLRAESILALAPDRHWTDDGQGDAHDLATGRYVRRTPRSWRRLRVVPQMPAHQAELAWADWVDRGRDPVEGLVVVRSDARIGQRGCKQKVKQMDGIDAVCLRPDGVMLWRERHLVFTVPVRRGLELVPGSVYECRHEGHYERDGTPKFARLVRRRLDLDGSMGL